MRKLDQTISELKLALVQIEAKEKSLAQMERQAREQYKRIINFTLYEGGDLDRALEMMGEVGQRAEFARGAIEHLHMVKRRAEGDLRAMTLTKTVEDAKAELAELQERRARGAALNEDIQRLESRIAEASEIAGRLMMGDER